MNKLNFILAIFLLAVLSGCVKQQINNQEYVARYKGVFTRPAQHIPTKTVPDGPISGNGDLGIVIGGQPDSQTIYISKVDFWKAKPGYPEGGVCLPGGLNVSIPELNGASFYAEQIIADGTVKEVLKKDGIIIHLSIFVPAGNNSVIMEMYNDGKIDCHVNLDLWAKTGLESKNRSGEQQDVYWVSRSFDSTDLDWPSHIVMAMKTIGASGREFVLKQSERVSVVIAASTNHDTPDYYETAIQNARKASVRSIEALKKTNNKWWKNFWDESLVQIGDTTMEKYYYGGQYILASCSRNINFPPGLWGNTLTMDATFDAWEGDYHTDYNHQAPWWAVYSSNHIELSEPYDVPILDYLNIAKENARKYLKVRGVYYDVGIGPKGLETTFMPDGYSIPGEGNRMFLGQKSNAVFATVNMFMRFYSTYDLNYAELVYPFLSEVADFWEDYLRFEDNRYVITGDAIGEVGDGGSDKNNCLSLGFARMFFKGILDVSIELDRDAERRNKWKHILDHLSDFPTVEVGGILRIRGAEAGPGAKRIGPKRGDTRIEFQGLVWPSGVTGLGSDPKFLKILQDDVKEWPEKEWIHHFNGFNTTFPAAVRVGHDPQDILARLRKELNTSGLPNLWVFGGGGGIENCCGVPATINEMLLQSHEGLLRLFPVWPESQDARFENLRAYGAFLVSSSLKNGKVEFIRIISEKGRRCTIKNPWIDKQVYVTRENGKKETVTGIRFSIKTEIGEKIIISA